MLNVESVVFTAVQKQIPSILSRNSDSLSPFVVAMPRFNADLLNSACVPSNLPIERYKSAIKKELFGSTARFLSKAVMSSVTFHTKSSTRSRRDEYCCAPTANH